MFVVVQGQPFHGEQSAKPADGAADLVVWAYDDDVIDVSKVALPELGLYRLVHGLQREVAEQVRQVRPDGNPAHLGPALVEQSGDELTDTLRSEGVRNPGHSTLHPTAQPVFLDGRIEPPNVNHYGHMAGQ